MITNNEQLIPRVTFGFTKLNIFAFIAFLRNVVAMCTAKYTTTNPPLADVTTALNELDVLANAARGRGRYEILARNTKRKEVTALGKQLAAYVQNTCNNSVPEVVSTGFEAARRGSKYAEIAAPTNARLSRNTNSGVLDLRFDKSDGAVNYTVQVATSADGPWTEESLSTSSRVQLKNRVPGTTYFARIRANGAPGSSEFTPATSAMAV